MEDGTGCTGTFDGYTSREIHPNSYCAYEYAVTTLVEIRIL